VKFSDNNWFRSLFWIKKTEVIPNPRKETKEKGISSIKPSAMSSRRALIFLREDEAGEIRDQNSLLSSIGPKDQVLRGLRLYGRRECRKPKGRQDKASSGLSSPKSPTQIETRAIKTQLY